MEAAQIESAAAVKERPILFSGEMVRAILEGRKTQTRRVMKPQPKHGQPFQIHGDRTQSWFNQDPTGRNIVSYRWHCPYGVPGDRLWLRETWGRVDTADKLVYRANPADDYQWGAGKPSQGGFRWRPSIHMPRSASRITLEITGVRVEPLQAISDHDAMAEGGYEWNYGFCHTKDTGTHETPRRSFFALWDSINGGKPGASYDDSPWVWVIKFRRIENAIKAYRAYGTS